MTNGDIAEVLHQVGPICPQHSGCMSQISTLEEKIEKRDVDCDKKLPVWVFIFTMGILVSAIGGMIGFQWMNYSKLSEMSTNIAVLASQSTDIRSNISDIKKQHNEYDKELQRLRDKVSMKSSKSVTNPSDGIGLHIIN